MKLKIRKGKNRSHVLLRLSTLEQLTFIIFYQTVVFKFCRCIWRLLKICYILFGNVNGTNKMYTIITSRTPTYNSSGSRLSHLCQSKRHLNTATDQFINIYLTVVFMYFKKKEKDISNSDEIKIS